MRNDCGRPKVIVVEDKSRTVPVIIFTTVSCIDSYVIYLVPVKIIIKRENNVSIIVEKEKRKKGGGGGGGREGKYIY